MAPAPKQAGARNSGGYRSRREKNEENKRRQRLKELEETLTGLEQEISQLQDSLSDPAVMGDYVKMQQVCVDLEERKAQYSRTEDEWLQLAETLG
ncbi:MAG: ABC transporter C-terminal domain-containing protein [Oscillospiraceae bacterium]